MIETTTDDFELFEKECRHWIAYFGLIDWSVDFQHMPNPAFTDKPMGSVNAMYEDKVSIFYFHPECPEQLYSDKEISLVAFHEVCELLMMEFYLLALRRDTTVAQLVQSCHGVIHRLTNTVFAEYWKERDDFEIEFDFEELPMSDFDSGTPRGGLIMDELACFPLLIGQTDDNGVIYLGWDGDES